LLASLFLLASVRCCVLVVAGFHAVADVSAIASVSFAASVPAIVDIPTVDGVLSVLSAPAVACVHAIADGPTAVSNQAVAICCSRLSRFIGLLSN
jgi:hypothetical protein